MVCLLALELEESSSSSNKYSHELLVCTKTQPGAHMHVRKGHVTLTVWVIPLPWLLALRV